MKKLTDKEVLQKAIETAINNGFKNPKNKIDVSERNSELSVLIWKGKWFSMGDSYKLEEIIFSHDFAKALFGTSNNYSKVEVRDDGYIWETVNLNGKDKTEIWKLHIQQMVLFDNPIDYLRKFIDNTENTESK